ncbi:ABC-type multidrug transport system fused ATPase/permease subunit [Aequitasia blattaphilus]|uniref:ABC transporter permease n=1 Tax=Aequitasia blattaphilus TaxID=2949332 RepID=A0ABT1E6C5_9FIRM|nr:hypothetical protein [Aequitasia blattaphilus]MCP1101380.1 hypothetical protein [Aequitasia blattaphilus]MCR8614020.1 hypothetical protein [Aequitasia blattaphilus]
MEKILTLKEEIQFFYGKYTNVITRLLTFLLAFVTFYYINHTIGFMKMLTSPLVSLGLAVICAFLTPGVVLALGTVLILAHMYALSLSALIVVAVVFLVMYVFYFRVSDGNAVMVLLSPLAFWLRVPFVLPTAYGLTSQPSNVISMLFGTVIYYVLKVANKFGGAMVKGDEGEGLTNQIVSFSKQVFQNKEMLLYMISFVICFICVYTIRKMAINHGWKIAIISGTVVAIVTIAVGSIFMNVELNFTQLMIGGVLSIVVGLILELFLFSVDYSRTESLEFEDDLYVYYVKAVPKSIVNMKRKTIKTINKRQESQATQLLDADKMKEAEPESESETVDDKTRVITPQNN